MTNGKDALLALSEEHPIVFFDGVCGLCNAVVDWILVRDKEGRFRFAPLQGETAALFLTPAERADLDTVVVVSRGGLITRRSTAIVEVLRALSGVWGLAAQALSVVPLGVRDLGYKLIARSRYRIWGRQETCRVPSASERARFLN